MGGQNLMSIEFRNVTFGYTKEIEVLKDFNLKIEDGQMVSIIGHNGSGKSTIAKLIVGLVEANSGSVLIDEVELSPENIDEYRLKMGIIFQNPDNQFVGVTVKDDIAFGLENHNVPRDEMIKKVNRYAELVGMEEFLETNPENLSGGQKQRVAIAGVLAMETEIIIFDEATSMLDPRGTKEIIETIKSLKKNENKTIIMITHNLEEVVFSDRVIVLNDGKIALDGTPREVLSRRQILEESGLAVIDSIQLISEIEQSCLPNKEALVEALWELTFAM